MAPENPIILEAKQRKPVMQRYVIMVQGTYPSYWTSPSPRMSTSQDFETQRHVGSGRGYVMSVTLGGAWFECWSGELSPESGTVKGGGSWGSNERPE